MGCLGLRAARRGSGGERLLRVPAPARETIETSAVTPPPPAPGPPGAGSGPGHPRRAGVPAPPSRAFPPCSKASPLKPLSPPRADHAAEFMERDVLAEIPPSLPSALNPQPALPGRPHDTEHAKTASFCLCISNLFYLFDISHT